LYRGAHADWRLFVPFEKLSLAGEAGTAAAAGTDRLPSNNSLDAESRQFASLLVQCVAEQHGPPIVMFVPVSPGMPVSALVRTIAVAVRDVQRYRVALICLSGKSLRFPLDTFEHAQSAGIQDWMLAETSQVTIVYRTEHTDVVSADEFAGLLSRIRGQFDFIMVEAGSSPSTPQTFVVVPYCSGIVILVRPGITTVREVEQTQSKLTQARAKLIGCAFVNT